MKPLRRFSIGVSAGDHRTPGFQPGKGNPLPGNITLQKARTWDEGVADKFQATSLMEIFKGKRVALFAVPGPFTGTCDKAHVPSFSANASALKAKGIDRIICVSTCDPYVVNGWAKSLGDNAKGIEFYSDNTGKLAQYLHSEIDLSAAALCGARRFDDLVCMCVWFSRVFMTMHSCLLNPSVYHIINLDLLTPRSTQHQIRARSKGHGHRGVKEGRKTLRSQGE